MLVLALLFVGCTETIPVGSSGLLVLDQNQASQWREAQPRDVSRVPVGSSLVEDMILLSPATLLVGLKNYDQEMSNGDYLLLDTSTGSVQWRYTRSRIGDYSVLDSAEDRIVFRVEGAGKVDLVGLDSKTGKQVWSVVSKKAFVQIVVSYEVGIIAVVEGAGNIGTVTGYDRSSGEKLWKREFGLDSEFDRDTALLAMRDRLWYVGSGVECLDGRTGKTVWNRDDVNPRGAGPNPQLGDGVVALIDRHNRLMLLDAQSGNTRWSTSMTDNERVSSLFPAERCVYVRSKTNTVQDFCNAIENLGTAMQAAQRQAYLQADLAKLRRLSLIYRSLMSSYGMAESAEYAYRPHRENGVTGVLLTHLSSGNRRFQALLPTYEEYGLWAAVDLERGGVIYHHGMRRRGGAGQPDTGPLTTHLIASEIDIPRGQ